MCAALLLGGICWCPAGKHCGCLLVGASDRDLLAAYFIGTGVGEEAHVPDDSADTRGTFAWRVSWCIFCLGLHPSMQIDSRLRGDSCLWRVRVVASLHSVDWCVRECSVS